MPKPTDLPRWADDLADPGDIVEPLAGKKDIGWQDSEKPPHSYMNWLFNLIYQWTVWLDGFTDEALTWTAAHVFEAGVTFEAAVTFNGAVTLNDSMTISGALEVGTDLEVGDDLIVNDDLTVLGSVTGDTTFDDDLILSSGSGLIVNKSTATPASDNELVLGSFVKAWAEVQLNGTATPAVTAGLNIASVTADSTYVYVTLTRALGTAGIALSGFGNGLTPYWSQRDGGNGTTTFNFRVYDVNDAPVDPDSTNGPNLIFIILGV